MENLNPENIEKLRSMFGQMNNSRRQLRPILDDIAGAIDKGFFIDADSEEVHQLLQRIIEAQQQLSSVEQLKKSVNSKRLDQIDRNISLLEQNSKRDEINSILGKIETLVVDSNDPAIVDAVKKVKLQAEHIRNKSLKLAPEEFARLSERFIILADIIDNAEDFSSGDYLKITSNFQDNPLIAMVLTSRLVHFPKIEEPKIELPEIIEEKVYSLVPTKARLRAVKVKFDKVKPNLDLVSRDLENFLVQKPSGKKQLSIKSFNNKIHQLFDSVDPLPVFKILIKTRIFFAEDPKCILVSGKLTKKIVALVPRLFDKLFDWGVVDTFIWRDCKYYFLNDYGLDLCVRCFTHGTASGIGGDYFETMLNSLQFSVMLISEPRISGKLKFNFAYNPIIPAARAEFRGGVILFFSLILLGDKWDELIAQFKILIESQLDSSLRAVFIFGLKKEDIVWLKMFDTMKFKRVHFFMMTMEGLFSMEGEEVDLDLWAEIIQYMENPQKAEKQDSLFDQTPTDKSFYENEQILMGKKGGKIYVPEKKIDVPPPAPPEIEEEENVFNPAEVAETDEPKFVFEEPFEVEPEPVAEVEIETPVQIEEEKTSEDDLVKADILSGVTNLFKTGEISRGMLSLHALNDYFSEDEIWADYLTKEIGFILDDPIVKEKLQNFDTFSFWTGGAEIPKANIGNSFDFLNLAATIKNFFAPSNPTSYQIQKLWNQINDDKSNTALKTLPAAKTLISLFNNFTEKTHRAFSESIDTEETANEDDFRNAVAQLKEAANISEGVLRSELEHPRARDVFQQLFKTNGSARKYLNVDNFSEDEIIDYCQQYTEINLREFLQRNNARVLETIFSDNIINNYLDHVWETSDVQLARRKHERFMGPTRKRAMKTLKKILFALVNYLYARKNFKHGGGNSAGASTDKALEILAELKKQIQRIEKRGNLGFYVFRAYVENLSQTLQGESTNFSYKICLLGANYIEIEDGLPVANSFGVEGFSLKNRCFDFEEDIHDKTLEENLRRAYESALKNYDCGILQELYKNFNLKVSDEEIKRKISGIERQVDREIDRIYTEFLNDLELAKNYSRITDQEKIDAYINAIVEAKKHFALTRNAGLFQRFVNACNESINKVSLPQRNALKKRLGDLEEKLEKNLVDGETLVNRYPILVDIRRQIDLMNLTVAEDYMNRLETEGGNLLTELDVADANLKTLEEFISEYEVLYRAVVTASGSVEGAFRQRMHIHANRANRETQNALEFVRGWKEINSGQNPAIESAIILILNHLGYSGGKISSQNINNNNAKSYTVTFAESFKARDSYPHPFAVFGTEIYSKGLEIIYLSSNRTFDNIAQVLGDMTAPRGMICLVNTVMSLPARRALAKSMKLNANLKNIVVIDKVMALYLTRFDDAQRGKKMLQVALPFARVQPYTQGGVIAPEMFIGRSEELDQIRDMQGPVFVYGGRQLGKSALLRQVRSLENDPSQLNYAFFIDLKNLDSEQTLKKIVYELQTAKLLGEVEGWRGFSTEMHKLLDGQLRGVYKPKKLLLLLDESDSFLSSTDSEAAIDVLRELLVTFSGQFKFVIAGLHKVIRFEQNSSFGNLNHISILPFKPSDAMELLLKPMSYLGFRVTDDGLVSAIFSRANYYPGSIQFYCKMLVDAVGSNYVKQNFDVTKNPPYILDNDYLKNMLGNRDFQEEINQKFQLTLHLDDDNYYEILALAVAWVYYEHGRPVSVEVNEIRNVCIMCGIKKITKLTDAELLSLLDEMVALNLLRRTDGKFEFNRYAFWHMLGSDSEVSEKLESYDSDKHS